MTSKPTSGLSKKIKDLYERLSRFQYEYLYEYSIWDDQERHDQSIWFFDLLNQLDTHIRCYLETHQYQIQLDYYNKSMQRFLKDAGAAMHVTGPQSEEAEPTMTSLDTVYRFIASFDFIGEDSVQKHSYLNDLLENSDMIVAKLNVIISGEAPIYQAVRWMLQFNYPGTRPLNKARFIKQFSTYHPDILIPELRTAVEYKLVRNIKQIESFIVGVKTDADNYSSDPDYERFCAVFYIKENIDITEAAIRKSLKEKQFPNNWSFFIVNERARAESRRAVADKVPKKNSSATKFKKPVKSLR